MKRNITIIVLALVAFAFTFSKSINDKAGIARVQKILGKEVYVLSEPMREYDVVERLTTNLTTMLSGRSTIQKQMQEVIDRAIKRNNNGKIGDFDAVLTTDGDVVILVKFKD